MAEYKAVEITAFNQADPLAGTRLATRTAKDPGPGEVQVRVCVRAFGHGRRRGHGVINPTLSSCIGHQPLTHDTPTNKRLPLPRAPPKQPHQVKLTLAPINPSDVFSLMGIYPAMGKATPAVPGFDGADGQTRSDCVRSAERRQQQKHEYSTLQPPPCIDCTLPKPNPSRRFFTTCPISPNPTPPTGVGVVTKVGPGVEGFKAGQRVTARPWGADESNGSWQQITTVAAKRLVSGFCLLWMQRDCC
jgi:hypothetical protein